MSDSLPSPGLDPDAPTGRRWAREELGKGEYSDGQSYLERLDATIRDLWEDLVNAFDPAANPWGTVVLIVLVLALIGFIVWRVGRPRAGSLDLPARAAFDAEAGRPASEIRASAEAAAAAGDYQLAVQERFRAGVSELSERSLASPGSSDTAGEVARAVARELPWMAPRITPAAAAFDEVTFGELDATAATYDVVAEFDRAAMSSSPAHAVAAGGADAPQDEEPARADRA